MKTEKVEIEYNEKLCEVEMQECKFGAQNTAINKAIKKEGASELSAYVYITLECIKQAPFPLTIEALNDLPASSGNELIDATKRLIKLTAEQKKSLNKSSGDRSQKKQTTA